MRIKPNVYKHSKTKKAQKIAYVVVFVILALVLVNRCSSSSLRKEGSTTTTTNLPEGPAASNTRQIAMDNTENLYEGPILYHSDNLKPIHLILVEKDLQRLNLYHYDGRYQLVKSYQCVTGKQRGDKEKENDDKTPEGIYFNIETYRDDEITVFGDRAFGLNYPDVFDEIEGKGGSGIFIHGSNRKNVTPYSTNGCLVLDNKDLADLDRRIRFKDTPIIIGKRLHYRFSPAKKDFSEILPILKRAMLPKAHARATADYDQFLILGYPNQIVAMSKVQINKNKRNGVNGRSRVYLADSGKQLLVLLKREWHEERRLVAAARPKPARPVDTTAAKIRSIVESWRSAWEQERINDYISSYHSAFIGNGRNLSEWKQYKEKLNQRYKRISVKISNLKVIASGQRVRAYFRQRYKTESYDAEGYKRLDFRKERNTWKIFRETSFPSKPPDWPA